MNRAILKFTGLLFLFLSLVSCVKASLDGVNYTGSAPGSDPANPGNASAPTVSSISPTSGTTAGGTSVSITGTGFWSGATATVGGSTCTSPTISSTSITCSAPAHAAGAVDVVVTNVDGQSGTKSSAFTYQNPAPDVVSLSISSGSTAGGDSISITGTGFLAGAVTTIGGATCTAPTIASTSISCTTPAHAAGAVDVVVTNTDAQTDTLSSSFTYNGPIVSSWSFVDGNGATGINKDTAQPAMYPQITEFNSKLYSTWMEAFGGAGQIRISVYNGNDSSPTWSFVDGNANTGINKDTSKIAEYPQITAFNSKLYGAWTERNVGAIPNIRISVYNGNDSSPSWSFVDGNTANGINKASAQNATTPQITAFNSKLYATWSELNGVQQIRVSVYNGNDSNPSWSFVDGNGPNGINKDTSDIATSPQLTVFNLKLYATWEEDTPKHARVAVYNGNDTSPSWTFVDGNGANGICKQTGICQRPQLTVFNSKLYATWDDLDSGTAKQQVRVAVYNGNDSSPSWTFVDGNAATGLNKSTSRDALMAQLTASNGRLYASWEEADTGGAIQQVRVVVYNGNDSSPSWSFVDGNAVTGLNKNTAKNAYYTQLTDFNSKLYATWDEITGVADHQTRMKVGQ